MSLCLLNRKHKVLSHGNFDSGERVLDRQWIIPKSSVAIGIRQRVLQNRRQGAIFFIAGKRRPDPLKIFFCDIENHRLVVQKASPRGEVPVQRTGGTQGVPRPDFPDAKGVVINKNLFCLSRQKRFLFWLPLLDSNQRPCG